MSIRHGDSAKGKTGRTPSPPEAWPQKTGAACRAPTSDSPSPAPSPSRGEGIKIEDGDRHGSESEPVPSEA